MQYGQLVWGVLSTFAAFLVGLVWQRFARIPTHLRARSFWRPLVAHDCLIVVGSFRDLPGFEASGVIGMGDNIALHDLERHFAGIGFKRFSVQYSHRMDWAASTADTSPLQKNLILLGGPDANLITRLVLERVALGIEFLEIGREQLPDPAGGMEPRPGRSRRWRWARRIGGEPWRIPVILDKENGRLHSPVLDRTDLSRDCGVLVRCDNPFNPRRKVIIFCGSYGYGTWAAVRYAQSKEFLSAAPKGGGTLECVLSVEVIDHSPQRIRMEVLRPVDARWSSSGTAVVPRIVG